VSVFVDTSALLAVLDADEDRHRDAARLWQGLVTADAPLLVTNYVVVETFAVVARRLGLDAVRTLANALLPLLEIEWVTAEVHTAAVAALLVANRRGLSLVDCVSFETMRRRGLSRAFAFDQHFEEQGFAGVG
jgi:predicted nucleic acid-binding protein